MERELVMPSWVREAAAYSGAMESSPSRSLSSSGCQSDWTLYLDHSNGNGMQYLPCDPATQRWMVLEEDDDVEDSMASNASSGPRPLDQEEDTRPDFERRPQGYIGQHSYSSSVHYCSASSGSGDGFGSWTSSSRSSRGGVKGHVGRRGVVIHGGEATPRRYREIVVDEEDELDDTARSSAVFGNPVAMVHVNLSRCRKHQRRSHELRSI